MSRSRRSLQQPYEPTPQPGGSPAQTLPYPQIRHLCAHQGTHQDMRPSALPSRQQKVMFRSLHMADDQEDGSVGLPHLFLRGG